MSLERARAKLAQAQFSLVLGLTHRADVPADFNAVRLQAAADALARKRAQSVGRAWPALRLALGQRFPARFADFAATAAIPNRGGPLADGRAFARYLEMSGELPDEGRAEAVAVDRRFAAAHAGLVPRRRTWQAWIHCAWRLWHSLLGRLPAMDGGCD